MSDHDFSVSPDSADDQARFDFYVEQLETYLDGELDEAEASTVRERLAQEPAYAAALDRIHRERDARMDLFSASAPDDDAVRRLVANACALASSESPAAEIDRPFQINEAATSTPAPSKRRGGGLFGLGIPLWQAGLAAAACVAVGFGVGIYGDFDKGQAPAISNPTPFSTDKPINDINEGIKVIRDAETNEVYGSFRDGRPIKIGLESAPPESVAGDE